MTLNPAFESDYPGTEHEAESVFLDNERQEVENETLGYGDADKYGCWHRFCAFTRSTFLFFAFGIMDSKAFYMTQAVRDVLLNRPVPDEDLTMSSVNSIDDLWKVVRGPLFEELYENKWYNDEFMDLNETYYIGYESVRLGLVRIRQLRMPSNSCVIPDDFSSQIKTCYATYVMGQEDRAPYGPKNSTAWTFTPGDELQMGSHFGLVAVYGGGGYYVDLSQDVEVASQQLQYLFDNLWIDRGTSVVFIHLTVYNPNMNLFCVVSLVLELPSTGGVVFSSNFRTVKLLRYVRTQDYVVLVFECLFLLFIVYYVAEEIIEITKLGYKYFRKFWNVLDILVIVLSCVCAAFNIYRTIRVNETLESLLSHPDEYSNFERLSYWEMQFTYAVGILVFLVWIKIFKYVSFNKTMNQLNLTLGSCAKDIAGFGVMFFIVFFAFAQLGYLAFGTQITDFGTFAVSVLTLFRIILGDFDFQALREAHSVLGPFYFLVYTFFVFFVLINMFIAIINDTYLDVKSNLLSQPNEFQMKSFFKKRLKEMRRKMKQKKTQLQEIQDAIDAVGIDECDMTINDLRAEMSDEVGGDSLEEIFRRADADKNMKLDANERKALLESLENKKMCLMEEMFNFQEAEIGHSYEQVSKMLSTRVASKEEVNRAYVRLIRLESCVKNVTERLRSIVDKLEQNEEVKNKRTEQMRGLLENLISAMNVPPPPPIADKQFSYESDRTVTSAAGDVRKRSQSILSMKRLSTFVSLTWQISVKN
ncbi:unnamed protein product [Mesocestoides corti]|uniref:EF-hand domain-containing protein n=1 Tax=Mesocestoides corti TaxID=53468 RepID=A0A0R3U3Y3_MESCO|nr:unnamed protein product [Mesocestoides corti]